jgi:hypothetical protein
MPETPLIVVSAVESEDLSTLPGSKYLDSYAPIEQFQLLPTFSPIQKIIQGLRVRISKTLT